MMAMGDSADGLYEVWPYRQCDVMEKRAPRPQAVKDAADA